MFTYGTEKKVNKFFTSIVARTRSFLGAWSSNKRTTNQCGGDNHRRLSRCASDVTSHAVGCLRVPRRISIPMLLRCMRNFSCTVFGRLLALLALLLGKQKCCVSFKRSKAEPAQVQKFEEAPSADPETMTDISEHNVDTKSKIY